MNNILIIGGSGFLSGTLARTAVSEGYKVHVITRGLRHLPEGVQGLIADRSDVISFKEIVASANVRWDAVFDCICYEPWEARQDIEVFRNLTDHLIFVSTDFVYDPGKRWFPQTEKNMHFLSNGSYGAKKRLCELEFINGDLGGMAYTVLRPAHIYGPGSELGCLPMESRKTDLIERINEGKPVRLAGGGYFLQQPIYSEDLAELMLSCIGNKKTYNEIFCAMGPDVIESRKYYEIIAEFLGVELNPEEVSVNDCLRENPELRSFFCHRIYDLSKLKDAGVKVPATPIEEGLERHIKSILEREMA